MNLETNAFDLETMQLMFDQIMIQCETESLADHGLNEPCLQSVSDAFRPLINCLLKYLSELNVSGEGSNLLNKFIKNYHSITPKQRILFCPQRQHFMNLAILFSRYFITGQVPVLLKIIALC